MNYTSAELKVSRLSKLMYRIQRSTCTRVYITMHEWTD